MTKLKKVILVLIVVGLGMIGLICSPFIFLVAREIFGRAINPPFSMCEVMDKARLEAAISQGFKVNAGCCVERMMGECSIARPTSSALIYAVEAGNFEAMQLLLDHAADPNKGSEVGDALTIASRQGRRDMIEPLLSHGTSASSQIAAIPTAAHGGHIEIATQILGRVAPEHLAEACSALFCGLTSELVQRGSPLLPRQRELFLHAIQSCPNPNVVCEPWHLLSHIARDEENVLLVKALLEKGADLNAKEENGRTVREFLRSFNDYNTRPKIKALLEGGG